MRSFSYHKSIWIGLLIALLHLPNIAFAWWNEDWTGRKPMRIDVSADGANITDPIGPTPVLVRLHLGNFRFEAANQDGSDLRFIASDDRTPLLHHVEKYDSLLSEALIWVGLPELTMGSAVELWLYYGNPNATDAGDAKGTYDKAATLIYHFGEAGKPPQDSSTWANHAINLPPETTDSLIGRGVRLNGNSVMTIPEGPGLVWQNGQPISLSVWARPLEDEMDGIIYSRKKGKNALVIGFNKGLPYVEVTNGPESQRVTANRSLKAGSFSHIAVTAGEKTTLYIDASPQGSVGIMLPTLDTKAYLGGSGLGDRAESDDRKRIQNMKNQQAGFRGDLDELQIAKVERPLGYFKFAVACQGIDPGKLLALGQDEESSGWETGYLPIIINSVTMDGWIVIILLGVMSVISWMVMVGKASYVSAVSTANERFLKHFKQIGEELVRFIGSDEAVTRMGKKKNLQASSLFRVFMMGVEEIRKRTHDIRPLSKENLNAVRASIDTGLTCENQRLSSRMVLLTIAISGGPFLGLLGTVVGVMITFAGVAAAGDVNVNAIAPGIAAALVATIAGLAVAIPALFGYNWLLTRIKVVNSNMQIFVDEFLAKAAEAYAEMAAKQKRSSRPQFIVDGLVKEADNTYGTGHEGRHGRQSAVT